MPIDLYYNMMSGPSRAVLMTARILNLELNLKNVDLPKAEHLTPEFRKRNPLHKVPVIVDDDLVLSESRAIITYLVNQYGKGSSLYPEEPRARALVDQRLYFDIGTLHQAYSDYSNCKGTPADESNLLNKVYEALDVLEIFLGNSQFVAGSHYTLADLSIANTIASSAIIDVDASKYPKIAAWLENVISMTPNFREINEAGKQAFAEFRRTQRSLLPTGNGLLVMPIDLYYSKVSAPCRAVMLVARFLDVELKLKTTDLWKKEHMTPEYLKLNPQHTIPTMVDDGFILWESRAIMVYLVSKYGKDSNLYPEEPCARALVDQMLYFDIGTLYQRFADYTFPQLFSNAPADASKLKRIEEALGFLETFLEGSKFVAGDHVTLADLAIVVTISNFECMMIDVFKYPRIKTWFEIMKIMTPGYKEVNEVGKLAFENHVKSMMRN